jgi:hypothetical protein
MRLRAVDILLIAAAVAIVACRKQIGDYVQTMTTKAMEAFPTATNAVLDVVDSASTWVRGKYFTIAELTRTGQPYANEPNETERTALRALIDNVLDPLREAYGAAITVNSGFRTPAVNSAVGGVSGSQHLRGRGR